MQFEKSFKIWINREDTISLEEALRIAKRELCDMVYDPLGIDGSDSWWWCVAVLEVLQQEDWIREFNILKEAPKDQQIEAKAGVVY